MDNLLDYEIITNDIMTHDVMLFPSEHIMEMDDIIQRDLYDFFCFINYRNNIIINNINNITYGIIAISDIVYIVFYNITDDRIEFREYIMFSKHQILNKIVESLLNQRDVFPERELATPNINNRWVNNIKNYMLEMNIFLLEISINTNTFIIINNNIVYILTIEYEYKPNLIIL
jgi:hypothetical protein